MRRIYLFIAGAFLILLVIISILLSIGKKSTTGTSVIFPFPTGISLQKSNTQNNSSFPTSVPIQESNQQNNRPSSETAIKNTGGNQGLTDLTDLTDSTKSDLDISTIAPIETEDFKLQYSSKLNKIVVEKKTSQAEQKFTEWANQNNYPQLINNPDLVSVVNQGQGPSDFNPLLEFLNIFMNFGQGVGSSTQNQPTPSLTSNPQLNLTPNPNVSPFSTPPTSSGEKVYYTQYGSYASLSLPNGCDLKGAGCGPTTVAMIAASYLGSNYNPKTIVDIYKSKGYLLGCAGSNYSDAKQVLQDLGLKTTDILVFNSEKADTVVPQLRKYLDAGWTFFTLAIFPAAGHYFWITDIDSQGNIWAYDGAYGRYQIPYNENSRYPYPLYLRAFGVKR